MNFADLALQKATPNQSSVANSTPHMSLAENKNFGGVDFHGWPKIHEKPENFQLCSISYRCRKARRGKEVHLQKKIFLRQ